MICANRVYFTREVHANIVLSTAYLALRPDAVRVLLVSLLSGRVALVVQFPCLIVWNVLAELNALFARSGISTMLGREPVCFVRL